MALVRFRLKKTVPFDVETAAVSYHVQTGNKVLVAVAPADVIAQYEAPFPGGRFAPGRGNAGRFGSRSWNCCRRLVRIWWRTRIPERSRLLVVGNGVLTLARSLELNQRESQNDDVLNREVRNNDAAADPLDEIVSNLYATRVYVEDQAGARPDRLYLVGFGDELVESVSYRVGCCRRNWMCKWK